MHFFRCLNDRFEKGAPCISSGWIAPARKCHQQHDFHEPNVIDESLLFRVSQGTSGIASDDGSSRNLDCASCHNNSKVMQASADRGKQLAPTRFHLNPKMVNFRQVALQLPRPTDGYTKTFASFSEGHPPFQLQRENVRDTNVLLFNHQHHLNSSDIPPTKGSKLDCNYCHQARSRTASTCGRSVSRRIARNVIRCSSMYAIRISNYRTATPN